MARAPIPPEQALALATLERAALRYLDRFDSSIENLRRVLLRHVRKHARDADPVLVSRAEADVDAILGRYRASGMLNDTRYAEVIASSLRERGGSRRAIVHRLEGRGVDRAAIDEALLLADRDTTDAELAAARRFARRRRLGPHRPASERPSKRDRDLGALARAGFSYDVAARVLDDDQ
ncbi:MAG: RecX family transcriptional regulator [Polyangiaceae bacterium]|nr:RecX family transcriptional regulator [Polyangiaceae bacterium]